MDRADVFATFLDLATNSTQAQRFATLSEGGKSLASQMQRDEHLILHGSPKVLEPYVSKALLGDAQDYLLRSLVQRALSQWTTEIDVRVAILEAVFGSHGNLGQHELERMLTEVNGPGDTPTPCTEAVQKGLKKHLGSPALMDKLIRALVNAARQPNAGKLLRTILVVIRPVIVPPLNWVLVEMPLVNSLQEGVYHILKGYLLAEARDFESSGLIRTDSTAFYIACQLKSRYEDSTYRIWLLKLLAATESAPYLRTLLEQVERAGRGEMLSNVSDIWNLTVIRSFADVRPF